MPAVTIRLTGELRPGRGNGRRGAGSGFGRQRPSTPTVVSGWERLAAVRLRSAATAAPAVADAPSAPGLADDLGRSPRSWPERHGSRAVRPRPAEQVPDPATPALARASCAARAPAPRAPALQLDGVSRR